jgi:triacylglycerol lipase
MLQLRARALRASALAAAAIAVTGAQAATAGAQSLGASGQAFYTAPSPLPAAPHGTLLTYLPEPGFSLGFLQPGVNAWKVMYLSQSVNGKADAVTGTVLVPTAPWLGSGPRPVVDFAVGTQGLSQASAPSQQLASGGEYEEPNIIDAIAKGWTVEVTDYAGYTNGAIPDYIVGPSEGHAVLDIAAAATQIPGAGISSAAKIVIWGYSQGGQASAWAAQLWPSYASGLKLVGDASGGVPANLFATATNLNGGTFAAFLLDSVIGLNVDYPSQINLAAQTNAAGQAAIKTDEGDGLIPSVLAFNGVNIDEYTKGGTTLAQLLAEPSVASVVSAQQLGTMPMPVPMFHYHAASDEVVPLQQDEDLNYAYCKQGQAVDWTTVTGDHVIGDFAGQGPALTWIANRLAGQTPPNNCSTSPQ